MKLFEIKNWSLIVSEEAWGLLPFSKILKRDKSKEKEKAMKEMLFVYFYCDIRSDYLAMKEEDRVAEIKHDIGLPDKWEIDNVIKDAITLYLKHDTVLEKLYRQTVNAINAIGDYLDKSDELLKERDVRGTPIYDISKISTAVQRVPKLMSDLKAAYKEVVKEKEDIENKKKGSKSFNLFENNLDFGDE